MILINCYKIAVLIARFGVGQNLYIYKQTLKAPANDWTAAVTDWYDEVALFRNKDVQPFAFSTATGHYTQVVWSTTDKVSGSVSFKFLKKRTLPFRLDAVPPPTGMVSGTPLYTPVTMGPMETSSEEQCTNRSDREECDVS